MKRLSYIEDARCLKVKQDRQCTCSVTMWRVSSNVSVRSAVPKSLKPLHSKERAFVAFFGGPEQ